MAKKAPSPSVGRLDSGPGSAASRVESAPLEPVGRVRRELKTPTGRTVVVEVPVYPPFRLKTDEERKGAVGGS